MALGIDIYRYQTVTDWNTVKRHGVSFVYVKGTDGGGVAQVRATAQVRGAQGVDLPVGLYHYAQLSPSPEVQADILTAEVRRLDATGLPPALDLEDPHRPGPVARDFARRFLTRLRANGFPYVTLYGNTSMLNGISADTLGVPGTVIWLAAYGPNDGRRHPHAYRGRVNIHQFTSVGGVPGISGQVDLNESLTPLPTGGKKDVELTDSMRSFIWPHNETINETVGSVLANGWSYAKQAAANTAALLEAHTRDGDITQERIREIFAEELAKQPVTLQLTDAQFAALSGRLEVDEDRVRDALADVLRHGVGPAESEDA